MRLVRFELAYGGTIMVNPDYVYLLEQSTDGVRIYLAPGEGKKNYTLKERDIWAVSRQLTEEESNG